MDFETYEIPTGAEFWTVNGSPDFGMMPAGSLPFLTEDAPIRLFLGDREWGAEHIKHRHGPWLKKCKRTVPQMLWDKCGQVGKVYQSRGDFSVHMTLSPSCLMILKYFPLLNFFSVTTIYEYTRSVYDTEIGRYSGRVASARKPQFALVTPPPTVVEVRKSRKDPSEDVISEPSEVKPRTKGVLSLKPEKKHTA
ncbi:hypothetical protein FHW69_002481 [Luteibacter sp. Sphag1AF]|uniref:hypothetical protein n=1 Tax=Luteibacter sp. Sphag1AF TaxID=2587031 RepID=UPI001607AAE2|nr:hypothetical protein [Luteibacter sp. Sphag1AF]MBB3227849.1 hypothetical protein [Luteibacter sp. Sphag1AF]